MDQSQLTAAPPSDPSKPGSTIPRQAVAGLTPPQTGEATIRETWPSLVGASALGAGLAKALFRTVVFAPLGCAIVAAVSLKRIAPFMARRYSLTNRRLMVQSGWKPVAKQEVALADIEDVRLVDGSYDDFYESGTLEVLGKGGQVLMTLLGVPEPEGFRRTILNACAAWVPGKGRIVGAFIAASATK